MFIRSSCLLLLSLLSCLVHSLTGCSCGSLRCQPTVWNSTICPLYGWAARVLVDQLTPLYSANSSSALWDQEQLCLLLPAIVKKVWPGLGHRWASGICFGGFGGWSAGPTGKVGKRHMKVTWLHLRTLSPSVCVGTAVPQARAVLITSSPVLCVSLSYSFSEVFFLPEQREPSEQTTESKTAEHIARALSKRWKMESLGFFALKWKPVSKFHWFWWKQSSAQSLWHLRLHRRKSNDSS